MESSCWWEATGQGQAHSFFPMSFGLDYMLGLETVAPFHLKFMASPWWRRARSMPRSWGGLRLPPAAGGHAPGPAPPHPTVCQTAEPPPWSPSMEGSQEQSWAGLPNTPDAGTLAGDMGPRRASLVLNTQTPDNLCLIQSASRGPKGGSGCQPLKLKGA